MKKIRLGAAVTAGSMVAGTVLVAGIAVAPAAVAADSDIVINEIESSGDDSVLEGEDWIELYNAGSEPVDIQGFGLKDDRDDRDFTIAESTILEPGDCFVVTENPVAELPGDAFGFGLGGSDTARLYDASGGLLDSYTWDGHASGTYGRCPDGTGDFVELTNPTPGAANDCDTPPPPAEPDEFSSDIAINEVESSGGTPGDWVEIINLSDEPVDISGWTMKDNNDGRTDTVVDGSVIAPGGLLVLEEITGPTTEGFNFGLGNPDSFRLYDLDGQLRAKYSWGPHATVTYARCPDGTGDWIDSVAATKGEPNDCSTPIRINEIESSGDDDVLGGNDWIELMNIGNDTVDVSGFVVKDNEDGRTDALPAGTTIPAGGLLLLVQGEHFGYGLGGTDSVRIYAADGVTLVDSYDWSGHADTSYGRCPDGTGEFETTASVTPGEPNDCAGFITAQAWPGGPDVTVLDDEDWFAGDMSGIDYEPSATGGPGTLWAVENGNGLLFKLTADATGTWSPASGWEEGRVLRYPDGTGTVDAEGVTVVDGEPGVVYVASERNNDESGVSRPSVLRYDVTGEGELVAQIEWNLAPHFPGLGANAGLEGITWIPDTVLTAGGLIDGGTEEPYDPGHYDGHGNGAFVVGVEGTGEAYVYLLHESSGSTVARLSTIDTEPVGFSMVADVQWDAASDQLWVVCDDACDGRIATYALSDGVFAATALYERPAGMGNLANEGFAIGDASLCVDGSVPTFYVDDSDTDGFSLRSGTLPSDCEDATPGTGDGSEDETDDGSGDGTGDNGSGTDSEADDQNGTTDRGEVCGIRAPASAVAGETIEVTVSPECAPATVRVMLFSEPTDLGTAAVGSDGTFAVTIPATTPVGSHTLEVRDLDGVLVGVASITVVAASDAALSQTGAGNVTGLMLAAALLATAGGALVVARRAVV